MLSLFRANLKSKSGSKIIVSHVLFSGFNPVWNATLNFVIHTPELALVRFVVEDYDKASRNDFIGQFTLPFTCIQPGKSTAMTVF